jgi:hypothetical protein
MSLFALHVGAQGTPVHPQPAPAGANTVHQPTPEQIAKMPVRALPIKDFKLLSSGTGWASTGYQLFFTTDNGAHWKDISPQTPALPDPRENKFSGVFFLDANTGWLLYTTDTDDTNTDGQPYGYDIHLASTTDGGTNWTTVSQLPRLNPWADLTGGGNVAFSDKLHGWVDLGVLRGGALFSTSDGGRTWQRAKGDLGISSNLVAPTEKDLWMAGGRDYKLFVTHDGGNTFQEVSLPAPAGIEPDDYPTYGLPVFTDELNGYEEVTYTGAGDDKAASVLYATSDGGRSWKLDRILANLAPGMVGNHQFSAMAGSTWIHSFAASGSEHRLMRISPNSGTTDGANAHLNQGNCYLSFVTRDEGWESCAGRLSSTVDGDATLTDITPRARNGVLTTDPATPAPTPKPLKTIQIKPAVPRTEPKAANTPSDSTQN